MARFSRTTLVLTVARMRLRIRQHRLARWAVVAALAGFAGVSVGQAQHLAQTRAEALGSTVSWPRAHRDLAPGHVLAEIDLVMVDVPRQFAPDQDPPTDLVGRPLLVPVAAGELLTTARFDGDDGVGSLLKPGQRGVALPADLVSLRLDFGDQVDVVSAPLLTDLVPESGRVVAAGATVISVTADAVVLAVSAAEAIEAANAIGRGGVSVVLSSSTE